MSKAQQGLQDLVVYFGGMRKRARRITPDGYGPIYRIKTTANLLRPLDSTRVDFNRSDSWKPRTAMYSIGLANEETMLHAFVGLV